ncbi:MULTISPECIES: paraquat-inducible protein A [Aliivibrio]|uniref:Paraquat-inducible membrane protein A n=1 Tax=Aliivibrio sifiae TaxID=566293 RepID=A0A2S7XIL2_9GAMM|nr:paraquat-inducible protein A [Aliivibrio sifiae]PQJ89160.1 paraquat-inducible membrane protein A [Aliivibrio sifiae]PQJ93496.1 paraquat-inducible membrane protein A [Aliivibrio sifiae]GLR74415.1 paraquat-inducible protein A [Aliivibrio sifiae]
MEDAKFRRCHGCDLVVKVAKVERKQNAHCPRCNTQLYRGNRISLNSDLAIAIAALLLFIPSHFFPMVTIQLFGVMIPATLPSGTITLMGEGFPMLGLLILFCSSIVPFLVCGSVVTAHLALRRKWFTLFRSSISTIQHLKDWMMLDVFLVSLAIACFKIQDHADIFIGSGLYGLILLQFVTSLLLTHVSARRYWRVWQRKHQQHIEAPISEPEESVHCGHCHFTQQKGSHCIRCKRPIHSRKPKSIQKTWTYLLTAAIFIIPANILSISILLTNGKRLEDTIFSGVAGLIKTDMYGIAIIIFVASIIVPVAKILGLGYLLLCVQFKRTVFHRQRMSIYVAVKWIGKWSVMDLFVISIMMTLIDRGQILDFTPGLGAVAFGLVVVFTMLAAESFDSRLIWDNYERSKKS